MHDERNDPSALGGADPRRLKDLLAGATASLGIPSPHATGKVWASWREIVGPEIAAHAEPTSLRGGVLRVRVDSPAWATEITYLAEEIRRRANALTGSPLVSEVRVWAGPAPTGSGSGSGAARRTDPGPEGEPREPAKDPAEAFERARRAWSKRRR